MGFGSSRAESTGPPGCPPRLQESRPVRRSQCPPPAAPAAPLPRCRAGAALAAFAAFAARDREEGERQRADENGGERREGRVKKIW